jgi:two-component system OmpR family sensor kinase
MELFEKIFSNSKIAICVTEFQIEEPGPKILYVNPEFEKLTGYKSTELIGKTPRELQGKRTHQANKEQMRFCLENKIPYNGYVVNYRKDRTEYLVSLNINFIKLLGNKYWIAFQEEVDEETVFKFFKDLENIKEESKLKIEKIYNKLDCKCL